MKKIIFSIITILLILAVIIISLELALRVKDLFDKNRGLKNSMGNINKKYCHGFKPNTRFRLIASKNDEYNVGVRINNYGFRGKDITIEKEPGVVRIMAIGDSFTFGVGAEEDETIPFLIEKELKKESKRVEVLNSGFGSYSPLLHFLKVRDEYLEFSPDLVIYFFDFSDLADDWRYENQLVYDKSGAISHCDPSYSQGKRDWWKVLRMHSKSCVYIHNKVVRTIDKIRILGLKNYLKAKMEGKRAKALIIEKTEKDKAINPIKYDGYLMIRGRDKLPEITEHFKRTEKYLNMIRDLLAKENIPMVLVIYPYGIHVSDNEWVEGRKYWGFDEKVYDDYYAFSLMEDYALRNGIPCINILWDFLKHKDSHLFFDIDGHFTPEANQIAAKAIIDNAEFKKALSNVTAE